MEARRSPLPAHLARRVELPALTATLGVAALIRLARLDLMEFKADEAEACRLALHVLGRAEPGVGGFFPTAGLLASVDVPNPPLFPYLLAVPLALVRSPLSAAVFVALANVVGVWLCYLAGKRCYSTFVGLCSAALLAVSPWAVVYSRKIWAQDLLVPLTCLFLLALHSFVLEKRRRSVLWLFVLVAAATQLHFSAWVLAVVLALALVLGRDALSLRWAAAGAVAALVLYAPYLWHLVAVGNEAAPGSPPHLGSPVVPPLAHRFLTSAQDTFAISGGDQLSVLVGSQPFFALPLSALVGGCGLLGLVVAWRRAPTPPEAAVRLLLTVWYLLPLAALTALPVAPFPHYFIVLYPLPFLGFAALLEEAAQDRPLLAGLAGATCLALFGGLDVWLFATVRDHGGAPADYGVAYTDKADAVRKLVRTNPGRQIQFEPPTPHEYRFLLWKERGAAASHLRPPPVRYVVMESFAGSARVQVATVPP